MSATRAAQVLSTNELKCYSSLRYLLEPFAPGQRANILNQLSDREFGIEVRAKAITDETLTTTRKGGG